MAHALARWARSAEEREEKLRKMRGTLYVLGDGHKTKKCLNSWKELVGRNHRAMLSVARMLGGQKRKAWERWHAFRLQNSRAYSRMLSAFSSALRKVTRARARALTLTLTLTLTLPLTLTLTRTRTRTLTLTLTLT